MLAQAVKAASRLVDRVSPASPGITVLIYHRVGGGTDSSVDLPVAEFSGQLDALVAERRVVTLAQALAELRSGTARPGVVITFDDGTTDFVDHALPALAERGLPATLYVATHFVDEQEAFPWGAPPLSWNALADVVASGLVGVESHSHRHLLLDRVGPTEAGDDLRRSASLIEDHLGVTPRHFAYPKAVPATDGTADMVAALFDTAAIARGGSNHPGNFDPMRLRRVSVQRGDSADVFSAKSAGGARLEGIARDLLAKWRYRGQTQ